MLWVNTVSSGLHTPYYGNMVLRYYATTLVTSVLWYFGTAALCTRLELLGMLPITHCGTMCYRIMVIRYYGTTALCCYDTTVLRTTHYALHMGGRAWRHPKSGGGGRWEGSGEIGLALSRLGMAATQVFGGQKLESGPDTPGRIRKITPRFTGRFQKRDGGGGQGERQKKPASFLDTLMLTTLSVVFLRPAS